MLTRANEHVSGFNPRAHVARNFLAFRIMHKEQIECSNLSDRTLLIITELSWVNLPRSQRHF